MNKEKQNIAIAKVCGWKLKWQNCAGAPLLDIKPKGNSWEVWIPPKDDKKSWKQMFEQENVHPPNYCDDLNETHKLEKTMPRQYWVILAEITMADNYWKSSLPEFTRIVSFATAEQRTKAILKTLDLWEDGI